MNKSRHFLIVVSALMLTLLIASLQLAWNLRSPDYLRAVAKQAQVSQRLAEVLPAYAATKLPNPDETTKVFTQNLNEQNISDSLDSLYTSISNAYNGKTDVVEIDLQPLTDPIIATGYQIPPGTVFASQTIQAGGLANVLRLASRALLVGVLVFVMALGLVLLLGMRSGSLRSLRSVLLITCLMLGGLFVATLGIPFLIDTLVTSSKLDPVLRAILLDYLRTLVRDTGRYYLAWIAVLAASSLGLSIASGVIHRRRRPVAPKKVRRKKPPLPESPQKEL